MRYCNNETDLHSLAMMFWRSLRPADLAKVMEAIANRARARGLATMTANRPTLPGSRVPASPAFRVIEGQ
jgi:hypothetical protein